MLDLLSTNRLIADGAGNPGFYGTAAVTGDEVDILRDDVSHLLPSRKLRRGHVDT